MLKFLLTDDFSWRINRYIVGCKFKLEKGNKATDWELIDT